MRFKLSLAIVLLFWSAAMVVAQKVATPDDLDKAMKKVQPALQATQKAIKSEAYADARKELATIKQLMDDTHEFWVLHKKEDAIKFNRNTVAKIDAVDNLLAATPVDSAALAGALKEMGGACLSCHKTYRVRDADNNWVLKPGSIGQ